MRKVYAHEMTDAQLKFIWHAYQERERMKKEKAERNRSSPSTPNL